MCGRYVASSPPGELARYFGAEVRAEQLLGADYNVTPTREVFTVLQDGDARVLDTSRWGLIPFWAKDAKIGNKMINARSETVAEKNAFRSAFKKKRCIIPADGFYEWQTLPHGKTPYFIHRADGRPLAFAGLWEGWKSPEGEWLRTCTIITGAADARLTDLHPRMPIVLRPDAWDVWLDRDERRPDAVLDLLAQPDVGQLTWHAVGDSVNNVRNDDPTLIAPAA